MDQHCAGQTNCALMDAPHAQFYRPVTGYHIGLKALSLQFFQLTALFVQHCSARGSVGHAKWMLSASCPTWTKILAGRAHALISGWR